MGAGEGVSRKLEPDLEEWEQGWVFEVRGMVISGTYTPGLLAKRLLLPQVPQLLQPRRSEEVEWKNTPSPF